MMIAIVPPIRPSNAETSIFSIFTFRKRITLRDD